MVRDRTRMVCSVQKASTAQRARSMQTSTRVPLAPLDREWVRGMRKLLVKVAQLGTSASSRRKPKSVQSCTRDSTEVGELDGLGLIRTCALSSPIARKAQQMQLPPVLTVSGQSLEAQVQ